MAQTTSERTMTTTTGRTPINLAAGIVGATFLLVGILGFVPGITSNLSDIEWIGHEADTELLGLFGVNIVHNLVHLAFGVLGLMAARTAALSRAFLVWGGVIYLGLWAYGLVIDLDSDWNFVSLNAADNWLHLGLGVGMVLLGLVIPSRRPTTAG